MVLRIGVEQPADHALILRIVFPRLVLEELNATLTQGDSYLYSFIPKDKVFGAREEVRDDFWVSEGFVGIPDFLAHRFAFLSASIQLRICGAHHRGR